MERAKFRFDPGVQSPFQKAPFCRVRAVEFERARITGAGRCAVDGDLALMIGMQLDQLVTRWTFPIVELTKIDESRVAVALRPFLRSARKTLQEKGHTHQEHRVGQGEEHFEMYTPNHACGPPAPATSVSRKSCASFILACGFWRLTPSHAVYKTGSAPPTIKTASPGRRSHSRKVLVRLVR